MNETTELIMKQLNSKKVHAETHEVGGGDEIDVSKLKNIEDYVTIDGDFAGTWNGVAMTSVEPGLSSAFNALKADLVQADINDFPVVAPEVDDSGRLQRAINSLNGKNGTVLLQDKTYVISQKITIPENVGLLGILAGRSMRTTTTLQGTVLQWNGASNSTMLNFDNDVHVVYNAKLLNIGFDGKSITGVKAVDLTNACYTDIFYCAFKNIDIGIYANGTSFWNRILFNHFDYFKTAGIWFQNSSNAWIILGNTINSTIHPSIGIYVKDSNGVEIYMNQFELGKNGDECITIDGSFNARGTSIHGNRFEAAWNYGTSETPCYGIHIKSGVTDTTINNNQGYFQETVGGTVYTNDAFILKDEGLNTSYDGRFFGKNYVYNAKIKNINSKFPFWSQSVATTSLSVDATSGDTIVNVTNAVNKYPFVYQMFDATFLRGKKIYLSAKFKADNITTVPRIEANCFQGGNGTLSNQGTYVGGTAVALFKEGEYNTVYNSFTVPTTADYMFINVNMNGSGAALPANNNVYVNFIALADKKVVELGDAIDAMEKIRIPSFQTSARPANPIAGLYGIDTTLNKWIWFDGTSWRDAMGTIV